MPYDYGDAGKAALKGGATGAAAGAALGPWGALVGGGIGAGYGAISNLWGQHEQEGQAGPTQNPYAAQWGALITQLQKQASGEGPSLAGNAYKQAQQTGMNNITALSRGGNAGAARQGIQSLGQMNQGLSAGYANAKLAEQQSAQSALQQALAGASGDFYNQQNLNRQSANDQLLAQQRQEALYANLAQVAATGYGAYKSRQRAAQVDAPPDPYSVPYSRPVPTPTPVR